MKTVTKYVHFVMTLVFLFCVLVASQDNFKSIISPGLIFETLALNKDLPTPARPKYLSPTDLVPSPDKTKLYVAEQTAKQIAVINLADKTVIKKFLMPNEPSGIAVSQDGSKLYVTITSEKWPEGYVCVVDAASGAISKRIKAGHSPRCPTLSPNGERLYVCNQYNDDISVIDLGAGKETRRIKVVREPYSLVVTPDEKTLVVANSLPFANATDTAAAHCDVTLIDLKDNDKTVNLGLTQGSHSVFGMTMTPDGKYALITHLVAMFNLPATQITGGWVHTNNLCIVDIANKKLVNDISVDHYDKIGMANPWGVKVTSDGKFAVIAHAGANELSIIDLPQVIQEANVKEWLAHKINLLYPTTIRKRVKVQGYNPRAVAIIDKKVYTAGYFTSTVEEFDISLETSASSANITLAPEQPFTSIRKGEYHYYNGDEYHCQGAWQSCQSCHPFARPDALDWMLAAGVTMQKNAKSMLFAWNTPPMNWSAKRNNVEESIRYGVIQELGMTPNDSVLAPIYDYLQSLKPLPSPHLVKGRLSESAARGREVYYKGKADCRVCHPAPLFTDKKMHTSIVADKWDGSPDFDTPNINEAWRTAPWDHIGTTTDFEKLLKNDLHSNAGDKTKVSDVEFKDLMDYALSL
jgi:YVTN family beta-propeller protein